MDGWNKPVCRMAGWIDEHIADGVTLGDMAREIGYSPTYCSTQFRRVTGMTLRAYTQQRRLWRAVIAIRDTEARLIDIALDCGYASHAALTAAFTRAFGVTPTAYRTTGRLLPLPLAFTPDQEQGGEHMLTDLNIRVEYIPAHRYLGVFRPSVQGEERVWPGHDCDLVTHTVESLSHLADVVIPAHTAGWTINGDARRYFYGLGVPADYDGAIPAGFELRDVPGGYYQVVSHPPFDYAEDNAEVMRRVEALAFENTCAVRGFRWSYCGHCYQRHYPEGHGYMVLRPIERI
ncbi:MAG: helix-turn-helix transcriptional regulator [Clostridia bacterium]|nr:helix-turn-helix transcriptional regulator [Clostridia bacterium]